MQNNLTHTIFIGSIVFALFVLGECLHHYAKVKAEYTRKIIHVGTGFVSLLCPLLIDNHWYVLALCLLFAALLILSIRLGFLESINNIGRESFGSVSYVVAVYLCFLVFTWQKDVIFFYMPLLILAVADPLAALIGRKWEYGKFIICKETKTISGSIMFFISALVVSSCCIYFHGGYSINNVIWISFVVGVVSALTEALTGKGLDNITIPLVILILIFIGKQYNIGLEMYN